VPPRTTNPSQNYTRKKKWAWPSTTINPKNLWLKLALRLWRAAGVRQGHHKITSRRKCWHISELRELPKIWGLLDISVMAEASDFKFGIELGFAKSNYKITSKTKVGEALVWGAPKIL